MKKITKIKPPGTLQALAYYKIKHLLLTGQIEFNSIYSANKFSEILGVSRTPIRDALLQLVAEGLLISIRGIGFKIKEFSKKEISDFFETRKMIETHIIERIIRIVTEQDLKQMDHILKQMIDRANNRDTYRFLEADKAFHMYLVHLYNNQFLESIIEDTRNLISLFGEKVLVVSERFQEVINEHRSILEALQERNKKKAVKTINYHLDVTEKHLLENL